MGWGRWVYEVVDRLGCIMYKIYHTRIEVSDGSSDLEALV